MNNETDLINEISKITIQKWNESREPYLISAIGSHLKDKDYKSLLNGKKLKEWIFEKEKQLKVNIIQHPTQKEKIGLIPEGNEFDFEQSKVKTIEKSAKTKTKKQPHLSETSKDVVVEFLRAMNNLPKEDVDKVIIPTSVLAYLLGAR